MKFSVMKVNGASTLLRLESNGSHRPVAVAQNCVEGSDPANAICQIAAECLNDGFDTIGEVRKALAFYKDNHTQ